MQFIGNGNHRISLQYGVCSGAGCPPGRFKWIHIEYRYNSTCSLFIVTLWLLQAAAKGLTNWIRIFRIKMWWHTATNSQVKHLQRAETPLAPSPKSRWATGWKEWWAEQQAAVQISVLLRLSPASCRLQLIYSTLLKVLCAGNDAVLTEQQEKLHSICFKFRGR